MINIKDYISSQFNNTTINFIQTNPFSTTYKIEPTNLHDHFDLFHPEITNNFNIHISNGLVEFDPKIDFVKNVLNSISSVKNVLHSTDIMLTAKAQNILIYSSMGINGYEMNLTSGIIADAVKNIYQVQGNNVTCMNYVDNYNVNIGKILQYIIDNDINYKYLTVNYLRFIYQTVEDSNAYPIRLIMQNMTALQNGDKLVSKIYKRICDVCIKTCNMSYDRLNIEMNDFNLSLCFKLIPDVLAVLPTFNNKGNVQIASKDMVVTLICDGIYSNILIEIVRLYYALVVVKIDKLVYIVESNCISNFDIIMGIAELAHWIQPNQTIERIIYNNNIQNMDTLLDDTLYQVSKNSEIDIDCPLRKARYFNAITSSYIKYAVINNKSAYLKHLYLPGNKIQLLINNYHKLDEYLSTNKSVSNNISNKNRKLCRLLAIYPEIVNKSVDNLPVLYDYVIMIFKYIDVVIAKQSCNDGYVICKISKMIIDKTFLILGFKL